MIISGIICLIIFIETTGLVLKNPKITKGTWGFSYIKGVTLFP